MPSVMQTTSSMPAVGGLEDGVGGARRAARRSPRRWRRCAALASLTLSNTGKPSTSVPPLPGVTPPTTWVP